MTGGAVPVSESQEIGGYGFGESVTTRHAAENPALGILARDKPELAKEYTEKNVDLK